MLKQKAALNCLSLTKKRRATPASHIDDGQFYVSGVAHFHGQPVQCGVGDHNKLLGCQVLLDPEEGTMTCVIDVQIWLWGSIQQEVLQIC